MESEVMGLDEVTELLHREERIRFMTKFKINCLCTKTLLT